MTDETEDRSATLVDRLRGIYTIPVDDGAGLLNGKGTFTAHYETPPINLRAADEIERLQAEIEVLQVKLDGAISRGQSVLEVKNVWRDRAIHLGWRGE